MITLIGFLATLFIGLYIEAASNFDVLGVPVVVATSFVGGLITSRLSWIKMERDVDAALRGKRRPKISIGTKSVLFGYHQFLVHPLFVARAWAKLYGFPVDPRLWVAFFVHDLGYVGKPNMDGPEGEEHVWLGAKIMGRLFDSPAELNPNFIYHWHDFCLYHSRFFAKKHGRNPSKLCLADKLAFTLYPRWLCLLLTTLSGEIDEYMGLANQEDSKYSDLGPKTSKKQWFDDLCEYLHKWVKENQDVCSA